MERITLEEELIKEEIIEEIKEPEPIDEEQTPEQIEFEENYLKTIEEDTEDVIEW